MQIENMGSEVFIRYFGDKIEKKRGTAVVVVPSRKSFFSRPPAS